MGPLVTEPFFSKKGVGCAQEPIHLSVRLEPPDAPWGVKRRQYIRAQLDGQCITLHCTLEVLGLIQPVTRASPDRPCHFTEPKSQWGISVLHQAHSVNVVCVCSSSIATLGISFT